MTVVLGIDLATADARVVAVADDGAVLAERAAPLPAVVGPEPSVREQRADYLPTVLRLVSEVCQALGARSEEVVAACVTGTSGTVVPCDAAGRPVGPALLYDDRQAGSHAARLREAGVTASETSPMARIGLLVERGAALVLHTPDVVHAGLVGHVVPADTSHALKAGIDPLTRSWDPRALAALGLPTTAVPGLVHPGTPLGPVSPEVASRCGLPPGVRVVAGMTDGCTAQIAAGVVEPGETVGVLGTTLVLKGVSELPVEGLGGALYSHLAPDGRWWPGGASNVGARAVRDELGGTDAEAMADLERRATTHGPARGVCYPLRGVGERFPFAAPGATGFVLGGGTTDPVERYRAFLEGVAFVERLALETLAQHGVDVRRHHLAGGAARNLLWCRLRATVLDLPVVRAPRASSGYGAALLALAHAGSTSLADVVARTVGGLAEPVEPLAHERDRLLTHLEQLRAELGSRGLLPAPPVAPLEAR